MQRAAPVHLTAGFPGRAVDIGHALMRRLRFHAAPLLLVLAVAVGGQALALAQSPMVVTYPDTDSYLIATRSLLAGNLAPDPVRTPGYPLLLAVIFWLARGENLTAVVLVQAALLVLSAVEIYALVFIITRRRWLGALVAALVGGNLYLANWSRLILSEATATWLLISVMLCFAVYLRRPSNGALALLTALVVASVFTRPQMLYLPALLLALLAFRALRQTGLKRWRRALLGLRPAAAGMAAAYLLILLYMVAFFNTYGAFTITEGSYMNLLGMAMKYHAVYGMPYDGAGPQYAQMRADLEATQGYPVFDFIDAHPQYAAHAGVFYGAFGSAVLRAHPGYVARGTYDSFVQTMSWDQIPSVLAPMPSAPSWLLNLSQDISLAYACLPLLLVASLAALWRNPRSLRATMLATLMLLTLTHLATGSLADFESYARLRMPVDWAMLAVTVLAIAQLFDSVRAKAASSPVHGSPQAPPVLLKLPVSGRE
jgi:hypothetical protein